MKLVDRKEQIRKHLNIGKRSWMLLMLLIGDALLLAAVLYAADTSGMLEDTPAARPVFMISFAILMAWLTARAAEHMDTEKCAQYRSRWGAPRMAAVLTLCIVLMSYVYVGIWPFGDKSVVVGDMYS